jgi:hypothetical protein
MRPVLSFRPFLEVEMSEVVHMWARRTALVVLLGFGLATPAFGATTALNGPLPSWNEGAVKKSIIDFVKRVSTPASSTLSRPQSHRHFRRRHFVGGATCLFQLAFAIDRIKALAPRHPGWRTRQPFKALLGDMKALASGEDCWISWRRRTPA